MKLGAFVVSLGPPGLARPDRAPTRRPLARASRWCARFLAAAALSAGSTACTTGRYLTQAACGQLDIVIRARDVAAAAADPKVEPRTRELLAMVPAIKRFGEENSLRPTASYHRYADLQRPAAVWVVTAAEPLRFRSKTWWFPIVGAVPYLGWFERADALDLAADLRASGWDSDVGAADAYSTLGWFDDPVLSTMISSGDDAVGDLVSVILHESVHATLYVDGQTRFNESLAEFASNKMTLVFLDRRYGAGSREEAAFVEAGRRGAERSRRMHRAYQALEAVYASARTIPEKLAEKQRILVALRAETGFRRPLNNATLAAFKNYNSATPELAALYDACGKSWARFFATLKSLKRGHGFRAPNQGDLGPVLSPLIERGCPAP